MAETVKAFGRLDILVNNAGVIEMGTIETTSMEQYDRVMNINVRAMYHLTMLATPHLVATKGNVVNISSVNGMRSVKKLVFFVRFPKSSAAVSIVPRGPRVQRFQGRRRSVHPLRCPRVGPEASQGQLCQVCQVMFRLLRASSYE